jgi:carbohydrate diacid regulator
MNQKQLTAEIIPAEKLPGDLRYELSLSPDHIVRQDGYTYLSMGEKTAVFPDNPDTDALLSSLINGSKVLDRPASASGLFQRMLTDAQFTPDAELYKACRVKDKQKRSVVVFRGSGTSGKDLYTLLSQIAPVEKNDIVFPMDYQSAILIRETDRKDAEELTEFTDAVIGTMESEGITGIKAGIGREADSAEALRDSYHDALNALYIGSVYHRQDSVYQYTKQALERIVDSLPEASKEEIRKEYCQLKTSDLLSDEMLETVRVFFRNDLNLTAASKQLFIHRNTLNYRLDKIRKLSGLDLRCFHDAVVFSVIMLIPQGS